jgi:peptidyl-tRNA hydrolase
MAKQRTSTKRVKLETPSADGDPMLEPTIGRRVWAAYAKAGYNRHTFAAQLGIYYTTLQRSDAGSSQLTLALLMRAALLLGHTMDDLCFGKGGRAAARAHVDASSVMHAADVDRWLRLRGSSKAFVMTVKAAIARLARPVTLDWLEAFADELGRPDAGIQAASDKALAVALAKDYAAHGGKRVTRKSRSFQNRGTPLEPSEAIPKSKRSGPSRSLERAHDELAAELVG